MMEMGVIDKDNKAMEHLLTDTVLKTIYKTLSSDDRYFLTDRDTFPTCKICKIKLGGKGRILVRKEVAAKSNLRVSWLDQLSECSCCDFFIAPDALNSIESPTFFQIIA